MNDKMQTVQITVMLIIILCIAACKKSSHNNVTPATFTGCRITEIRDKDEFSTDTVTYTYTYNGDGTVSSIGMKSPGAGSDVVVKKFRYCTNNIVISLMDGGNVYSKDSLQLDTQNRVVRIDHWGDNEANYPGIVYEEYQYDSLGDMVSITLHHYTDLSNSIYLWKNGDIGWNTSGGDFFDYSYSATPYNTGNTKAFLSDFENYGRGLFTPQYLASMAVKDNADTATYNYILDSGGRVTQLTRTETGNLTATTLVTYVCE